MTEETTKTADPASTLARQIWIEDFKAANPDASDDEVKAAWSDAAPAYRKTVKAALRKLANRGITLHQA